MVKVGKPILSQYEKAHEIYFQHRSIQTGIGKQIGSNLQLSEKFETWQINRGVTK